MHIAVVGLGASGSHAARQLNDPRIRRLDLYDINPDRAKKVYRAVVAGRKHRWRPSVQLRLPDLENPPDVTILATKAGTYVKPASDLLAEGANVVTLAEGAQEVESLLQLDQLARKHSTTLVIGAGFAPGFSCLLAKLASRDLDNVDTINIAKAGTAGPECARQHHRALKSMASNWLDGQWELRRGGSGRDLTWFPEPIGARDCYRGGLASPMLLVPHFPGVQRVTERVAANRRDRATNRLPMLRRPHADGGPGGIRVLVKGRTDGAVKTVIMGAAHYPSVVSGTVAAVVATAVAAGEAPIGADGLAAWNDPNALLRELHARGVKAANFYGAT